MPYINVIVNAPGQAPILNNGTATSTSLGLSCCPFAASHLPVVGNKYTIHATDEQGHHREFEGYKCVKADTTSTFSSH